MIVAAFGSGMVAGGALALSLAWRAMSPNFRLLVRASLKARAREVSR